MGLRAYIAVVCWVAVLPNREPQRHEFFWHHNVFQDDEITWDSEVTYGDSIYMKCPTRKDQVGLGLKQFSLYYVDQEAQRCKFYRAYWHFIYTCDLNAPDDSPNVYTINIVKQKFPGQDKSFVRGERYTLVAMENIDRHFDLDPTNIPQREEGSESRLCSRYHMRLTFLVNPEDGGGDPEIDPGKEISPFPDGGFDADKENDFIDDRVEIEDLSDIHQLLPYVIGVIVVLVILTTFITVCLFRRRTTSHRKETHHSTMETTSSIRDYPSPGTPDRINQQNTRRHQPAIQKKLSTSSAWRPEKTVNAQIPRYVTPSDAKANTGMRNATSMDHLRRIRDNSPEDTLRAEQEGFLDGGQAREPGQLDNTTISRSIEYRRPPPEHFAANRTTVGHRTSRPRGQTMDDNTQIHRQHLTQPMYKNTTTRLSSPNISTPAAVTRPLISSRRGRTLASPNDTGCETGSSIDSHEIHGRHHQLGDTVAI